MSLVLLSTLALLAGDAFAERRLAVVPADLTRAGEAVFSADGGRVAYAAIQGGDSVLVLDGAIADRGAFCDSPVFSADGRHVAWRWCGRTAERAEEWAITVDGKRGKLHDWVGPPAFAAGGRPAFWAGSGVKLQDDGTPAGGTYSVIVGDQPSATYDGGDTRVPPRFGVDGKRALYAAERGGKWLAVAGKFASALHALVETPALSPDGKDVAFAALDGDGWVILDEKQKRLAAYPAIAHVAFSPSGDLAYAARDGDGWSIFVAGQRQPGAFAAVGRPRFSAGGARLAYAASKRGRWSIVIEGKSGMEFDEVGDPVFSPQGAPLAYRARAGTKWRVVVGAQVGPEHDAVGDPVFTADGSAVGYGARSGADLWWRVAPAGR